MTAATGIQTLGHCDRRGRAAVFAALGAMALLIPADSVRDAVKAEIRSVTGLDLSLRGDVDVSLFPTARSASPMWRSATAAEPALAADRLTARLRFFPLFAGRIEIADVALVRPRINVVFGAGRPLELVGTGRGAGARARPEGRNRPDQPRRSPKSASTTAPSS